MKKSFSYLLFPLGLLVSSGIVLVGGRPVHDPATSADEIRRAVARALPYIEEHGVAWMEEHQCVSCHQIPSMLWSYNEAAARGLVVDQAKLDEWNRWSIEKSLEAGTDNFDGMGQMILGRPPGADGAGPYGALAALVAQAQESDGSWKAGGQLPFQRRPEEESHRVSSMWSILALASVAEGDEALAKGRGHVGSFLAESGQSHEWTLVKLLYSDRFGDAAMTRELVDEVLAEQHEDGGWPWIRGEASDAFATGQTLYTLERVGWPKDDAAVERARRFLLETQRDDGSWTVRSTLRREEGPVPTSDFWGTGWAVVGLLRSLPEGGESDS